MEYNPTVWETGDIVTSEKLNNMEGGIAAVNKCLVVGTIISGENSMTFDLGITALNYLDNPFPLILVAVEAGPSVMKIKNFDFYINAGQSAATVQLYDPILKETYNGTWVYENNPTSFTVYLEGN